MFYAAVIADGIDAGYQRLGPRLGKGTAYAVLSKSEPPPDQEPQVPHYLFRVHDHPGTLHVEGTLVDFFPTEAEKYKYPDGPLVFIED